jgi:hypothetical protein
MSEIMREGNTVYELDPDGVNKWYFSIQPGTGLDGHRQPITVIEKVATKMAAVDDLIQALEISEGVLQSLVEEYPGHLKELHTVQAALAKAEGEPT